MCVGLRTEKPDYPNGTRYCDYNFDHFKIFSIGSMEFFKITRAFSNHLPLVPTITISQIIFKIPRSMETVFQITREFWNYPNAVYSMGHFRKFFSSKALRTSIRWMRF